MAVSVLILTLNEETNLNDCLASVTWCDDVVVFDSFSSDNTVDLAKKNGARVIQRRFDNYASQRNAALNEVAYRHPWVLMVDADERVTPELHREIDSTLAQKEDGTTLYRFRRKDLFFGRWLKRASGYPSWFGRLVRVGHIEVKRTVNEEYHTDGNVGFLREHMLHQPFNKGIAYWCERHNRYSSLEAACLIQETQGSLRWRDLLAGDPTIRRKALKQFGYRLAGRPLWVFIYLYLIQLGFLDGRAGFIYCILRAHYELMIDLKVLELRRRERGLPV
jgi:glycosyltransferase involved in cell wall biosynthesis